MFNGQLHDKLPFSIVKLVYQGVTHSSTSFLSKLSLHFSCLVEPSEEQRQIDTLKAYVPGTFKDAVTAAVTGNASGGLPSGYLT